MTTQTDPQTTTWEQPELPMDWPRPNVTGDPAVAEPTAPADPAEPASDAIVVDAVPTAPDDLRVLAALRRDNWCRYRHMTVPDRPMLTPSPVDILAMRVNTLVELLLPSAVDRTHFELIFETQLQAALAQIPADEDTFAPFDPVLPRPFAQAR